MSNYFRLRYWVLTMFLLGVLFVVESILMNIYEEEEQVWVKTCELVPVILSEDGNIETRAKCPVEPIDGEDAFTLFPLNNSSHLNQEVVATNEFGQTLICTGYHAKWTDTIRAECGRKPIPE